ncbi:MAG: dTMP kinase [Alphaproteobacteria bacterium]|nr:dTMP kinase [Alphaproteobacteria bacterium]
MIPLATILNIITLVLLAWVVVKRGYVYLHFFQQEEYHLARFFTWWVTRGAFDRKATLGAGLAWLCTGLGWGAWAVLPLWFGLVWAAITTHDPQQEGKKKLVMTPRATRIFYVGMALLLMIVAAWGDEKILLCLLLVHIIPLALMAANDVLWPFEEWVRQKYVAEAKNILASVRPAIIGITGSFGKTSVKHVLGHVLSAHAPVAWAAGSINTAMGLTRFVREHVRPGHKFLIAEMGAYQRGSVARLCKIFPPRTGIITTLGKELRAILHTQKALVCDLAEYLLFAADRAQHFHEIIVPALQRGAIVLADRLADSSLAYQGYGRGLNTEQIARTNAWAMQGLQPDLVVFCKIDPAIAAQRIRQRNEALTSFEQEKIDFWQRVDAGYEAIFAQRTNVLRIDASQPSDIQADLVVNALQAPVRRSSI